MALRLKIHHLKISKNYGECLGQLWGISMRDEEISAAIELLQSQLGLRAKIRLYDHDLDSPMNFLLRIAEAQLESRFAVFWVENALPEFFCLRGFSEPLIAYSTRYVELWADVRALLASDVFANTLIPRLAERLSLRLIAESSLSKNDPEFAACAMLTSSLKGRGLALFPNSVESLEREPISTAYMACWFYGLAHELGHFSSVTLERKRTGIFGDENILSAMKSGLEDTDLPREVRKEALALVRENVPDFILGLDTLRSEVIADIFATGLLFESTVKIMRATEDRGGGVRHFDMVSFIWEMLISFNVIALLDRCRRVATHACTPVPSHLHGLETALHPVAMHVRLSFVRLYLEFASSAFMFGDDASPKQKRKVTKTIDSIMGGLRERIKAMEQGLGQATRFALDRSRRPEVLRVIQAWADRARENRSIGALDRLEVERFCDLACSLGKVSSTFDAMLRVVRDPSAQFEMVLNNETVYKCPWVSGPDGFNRPFGLETRHGHLIFVFAVESEIFDKYFEVSADLLTDPYELGTALITAETERQLRDAIALRLPVATDFRIAIEGTESFGEYINELISGTIWR